MKLLHEIRSLSFQLLLAWTGHTLASAPVAAQTEPGGDVAAATAAASRPDPLGELVARCTSAGLPAEQIVLLQRSAEFLELLPMDALAGVVMSPGAVDLVFDFGGRASRKVEVAPRRLTVLRPEDEADPLARGRVKEVETDEHELIVKNRVRLLVEGGRLVGVRKGDLKIDTRLVAFNLELTMKRRPGRMATDEKGRILLALDEQGQPMRESGRYIAQVFDDWLVVEVATKELWIGLPEAQPAVLLAQASDAR